MLMCSCLPFVLSIKTQGGGGELIQFILVLRRTHTHARLDTEAAGSFQTRGAVSGTVRTCLT